MLIMFVGKSFVLHWLLAFYLLINKTKKLVSQFSRKNAVNSFAQIFNAAKVSKPYNNNPLSLYL